MTKNTSKLKYTNARLLAIQAVYAQALSGAPWDKIIAQLTAGNLGGRVIDDTAGAPRYVAIEQADSDLFSNLVAEIQKRPDDLAAIVRSALDEKFDMNRLDALLKIILTVGVAEFYANPQADMPIVINEYTDIARSFYDGSAVKLVNAVLDKVGRVLKNN